LRGARAFRQTSAVHFVLRRLRPLGFICLAALLAFAQQQAALHVLGHSIEQIAKQDRDGRNDTPSDAPESLCAKCLALAHLDHAVDGPVHATVDIAPISFARVATTISRVDLAPARAYESRAPPTLS
jgi:hypothetical protein